MARITVEDCLERIDNRFDLVLVAARRAHMLRQGSAELLPWDNDKPAVLALREIAAGKVTPDILDQPLQAPDDEIGPSDLETIHQQAAEMVVEDVSAANEEEDFDDEFDLNEEDAEFSADAASAGPTAEGARSPGGESNSGEAPAKGA